MPESSESKCGRLRKQEEEESLTVQSLRGCRRLKTANELYQRHSALVDGHDTWHTVLSGAGS